MSFSREQQIAYDRFISGKNLFITGPGGTGKTYLIKRMVQYLKQQNIVFQVCAMTGCAAVLLGFGAKTLHSWAGMGLATGNMDAIVHKIVYNKKTVGTLKKVRVLIVDEVSMLSKRIFEALNIALQRIRKCGAPFGGIQIIFTGDFFQLPPVGKEEECQFCFESEEWLQIFPWKNHIQLQHIFRQEDTVYKEILNQVRWGELDEVSIGILQGCLRKEVTGEVIPTKLFATRAKTEFVNTRMYDKLEGEEYIFKIQVKFDLTTYMESGKMIGIQDMEKSQSLTQRDKIMEAENIANNNNRQTEIRLKKGARVMCLHNLAIEEGICNGSQGIIVDFSMKDGMPIVLFSNDQKRVIEPVWTQSDEYPSIGVGQIPLCLAWALTIHKIQGATLSLAEMDLGNSVFEFGQSYVALSRIRNLEGLYLSAFQPKRIKANPLVKDFYRNIPELTDEIIENPFAEYGYNDDNLPIAIAIPVQVVPRSDVKIIRL
jgi:ATP-dependent DNA helicase PIF1